MNTLLKNSMSEIDLAWQALRQDDNAKAMQYARAASQKLPDSPEVAHILGLLASRDGRQDIALPLLQKAIDTGGITERRLRDIARALLQAGHPQAALTPLADAINQFGESADTLGLLAAVEVALERWDDAAESARAAIKLAPYLMAWEGTLAFCELIRQRWDTGFQAWSGRSQNLIAGSRSPTLMHAQTADIWLCNEQGPGDTLFFLRFAPALIRKGWRIHVQADRKLLPLLASTDLFTSINEKNKCPATGFWLNMGDLPLAAQQLGAAPVASPLTLIADPSRLECMREELAKLGPPPYIAVTWRGGARGPKQRAGLCMYDKFTDPHALGKMLSGIGGTLISVQRVPDVEEFLVLSKAAGRRIADYSALNNNLLSMLALLSVVDEYVAVPNTNVHLRESLGKSSHILLNRPWQDWRWLDTGENSPWYPNAQIYRQASDGSWTEALRNVAARLQQMYASAPIGQMLSIDEVDIRENAYISTIAEGWDALKKQDIPIAIRAAQQVMAQVPEHTGALHLLGWAALKDHKLELSIAVLEKAAALAPNDGPLWRDYIRSLSAAQRHEEALAHADKALTNPDLKGKSSIYYGRAAIYLQQARYKEALADYTYCLEIAPNNLDALGYSGMVRLKLGEARRGFREYSARREARNIEGHTCPWLRGDVTGLKLLVRREMGLGDELSYLRYLPWLTQAGIKVTYWAGAKLAPMLQRMGYADVVIDDRSQAPGAESFDLTIEVNETPVAAEALGAPEIAPPLPLAPRADLVEKWRHWLRTLGPGPYIGINWRAGAAARETSISFGKLTKTVNAGLFAQALAPVQAIWISLQRNITFDELADFRCQLTTELHDAAGLTDDLEDLLALLSLLDENIGVSNTNMHLRAGLGLGSRVLVQNPGGDWRWGIEGSHSPWFTESTVYRQGLGGDWSTACNHLNRDLMKKYGPTTKPVTDVRVWPPQGVLQSKRLIWLTAGKISLNDQQQFDSQLASTRYRVIAPAAGLNLLGWQSEIINEAVSEAMGGWGSSVPRPGDTVIISKVFTDHSLKLAADAKSRGAIVVADFCDNFFSHPKRGSLQRKLLKIADKVIASTEGMANAIIAQGGEMPVVIGDPVEGQHSKPRFAPSKTLKLLWFGHAINLDSLAEFLPHLARYATRQKLALTVVTTLANGNDDLQRIVPSGLEVTYTSWSLDATAQALTESDLVIIPIRQTEVKLAKSANRLIESLWAGRFVVAGNLPAYQEFNQYAWVGAELVAGIEWAMAHPKEVLQCVKQGQETIALQLSRNAIAKAWSAALQQQVPQPFLAVDIQQAHIPKRLNLGCGDKILPGYINVDVVASRGGKAPDILCDLHKLEPFADDSVDEVLSVHVVEHFWRWEVLEILKEWIRVLKPGGKLILECPNLLSACEEFLKNPEAAATGGPEGQRSMWVFYGDPRWQDPYMVHRWGYTPQSLSKLLMEAGLTNVRQEAAQFKLREPRDMRIVAEKPETNTSSKEKTTQQPTPILAGEAVMEANQKPASLKLPGNKSIEEHLWDGYLTWFYHANIWKQMTWHGIRTLKLPSDMWNYQEIIYERKVDWVIEAGTRHGGSALFFAQALAARKATGKVITMDIDVSARQIQSHTDIEFLVGDSGSQQMVEQVTAILPAKRGAAFVILDSDHSCAHVLRELEVWVPFMKSGDYLVVEDSAVNGHPVRPDFGPGPYEAVQHFLGKYPDALSHDVSRERKFGATQAPLGYFVKK